MARILTIQDDYKVRKEMEEQLSQLQDGDVKTHTLGFVESLEQAYEFLNDELPCHLILVDTSVMSGEFETWQSEFRDQITYSKNKETPLILLSHKDDPLYIRRCLEAGALDFIVKPVDGPILVQLVDHYLSGGSAEKQVYSMSVEKAINVAYQCDIEEISEFGVQVKTHHPFQVKEIVTFYSDVFQTGSKSEVMAKCYRAQKHPSDGKKYQALFSFVGATPDTRKQIRTWLRQEYVKTKQASFE